jgi:aconitate hydratase
VTTDHISPAGDIPADGPAGTFLIERGVTKREFNSFGARRGNHEVMIRGTLSNIRLKNMMVPGTEGGWTIHLPTNEKMSIYEASMKYKTEGIPLIIIAGKEYGSGSSRDWAAKGTMLLGVKAVIAESFERIHRSNLVGMGVIPLQFKPGENWETLNLTGFEEYNIGRIAHDLSPRKEVMISVKRSDGSEIKFKAICRLDSLVEIEYYRNGGILQTVLRQMITLN